ncbi:PhzF family phenazine biosynthesis protein [Actinocorallia herbida]|uniref:PhzF family phenazine biosynthesis protein n=1 Tax=Actinocorallia herbida TaxID=58109 RepID=A0A3N1CSZ2_9ACTN|nr:PhzF family phenazine biosynthesis isomerase [Actinocorallia herbida]ROO84426.1 PhzF family phenazine biosynthesis protein [Actinocorallia herbida]
MLRYSAFADGPEGGNPAGVVLDAAGLGEREMLEIAREVGYSETAFVTEEGARDPAGPARFGVRYFSPAAEVPFCGHATVALAAALAARTGPGAYVFGTAAGEVALDTVADAAGTVSVSFTSVDTRTRPFGGAPLRELLGLLGLAPDDLDPAFPPLESFAGNWHPMLVLKDRGLFHQFRFAPREVARLMRERGWTGTVTVLSVRGPHEYEARNLFPVGRITEDPATGSAAASTGAYLRAIGRAEPGDRVVIRQGAHVGRPSVLVVDVPARGGVTVTGGAIPIDG